MATAVVPARAVQLRDETVFMLCGLWMITGLYIDGWAHQANKPETFFTPWHLTLYSGFGAAVLYAGLAAVRDAHQGHGVTVDDRWTTLGGILFAVGGGGDFVWHEIAGIEADLEALVSPTHLLLMIGGLLMVTMPIRSALRAGDEGSAPLPVVASVGLAIGVVTFFLMYLSPFSWGGQYQVPYLGGDNDFADLSVEVGMAKVLVLTSLFVGGPLWAASRWRLPAGTATVTFTALAIGHSGLTGFDIRLSLLAATAAGIVFDALLRAGRPFAVVGGATGVVLWAVYFALFHAEHGVAWGPSLWLGAIVFAGLSGLATGAAVRGR